MNTIFQIILVIPRLFLLMFNGMLTYLYEAIHKKEIAEKRKRRAALREERSVCMEENTILREKLRKYDDMVDEITSQLKNGKTLLGIHHIQTNHLEYDPVSKTHIKEVYTVYFMYHEKQDSETVFIRAHFAGQIQEGIKEREPYIDQEPENTNNIFCLEGKIYRSTFALCLRQLYTDKNFRKLGIATLGIEYLKTMAINHNLKCIFGMMDNSEKARECLPGFYQKRGFKVIYPENTAENIRFEMQL